MPLKDSSQFTEQKQSDNALNPKTQIKQSPNIPPPTMNPHPHPSLRRLSDCFIKPKCLPQISNHPYYLSHWDLTMLSVQYIQKGLLFRKPSDDGHHFMATLLPRLKKSLSIALFHFYPLSGRLATVTNEHQDSISVYVDCVNSPGAKFAHAALDLTVSDILSLVDVPLVVHSLFDLDNAVNYDAHTLPLLSIQVTELSDGIFIGSSFNHSIGDGTSHWNFFHAWSEIFQSLPSLEDDDVIISISRPPILNRWFPDGYGPIINLPFTHPDQFIKRFKTPKLRERIFHFSKESIAELKAKANAECNTKEISSFQSLCALIWRSVTRARRVPEDEITICTMLADNRAKLEPPLCGDFFGNAITTINGNAKAGELMEGGLGWAALKLHEAVAENTKEKVREGIEKWFDCPSTFRPDEIRKPYRLVMTSSPRFDIYGNEFGRLGKAVGVRSGCGNKFDGKVTSYPGYEGGGSVDIEIALLPNNMANLESDSEFIDAVVSPTLP